MSEKVKSEATFSDLLAIDIDLKGKIYDWDLNWSSQFNSIDPKRLDESVRTKISLKKSIDLNQGNSSNYLEDDLLNINEDSFKNFLDFQIYSSFREKVSRGFSGEREIYFGSGLNIANRKKWNKNNIVNSLTFSYDLGKFEAANRNHNRFLNLSRNVFALQYENSFVLWEKPNLNKNIDQSYKYSNEVVKEDINWLSNLQIATFFYGDGSNQNVISFSTGPQITLGSFNRDAFSFSNLAISFSSSIKEGESPFSFDNVSDNTNLNFSFEQQIFGPLVLSYSSSLDLENGDWSQPNYALDIKRRAYSVGAFYDTSSEILGFRFNIYGFNCKLDCVRYNKREKK